MVESDADDNSTDSPLRWGRTPYDDEGAAGRGGVPSPDVASPCRASTSFLAYTIGTPSAAEGGIASHVEERAERNGPGVGGDEGVRGEGAFVVGSPLNSTITSLATGPISGMRRIPVFQPLPGATGKASPLAKPVQSRSAPPSPAHRRGGGKGKGKGRSGSRSPKRKAGGSARDRGARRAAGGPTDLHDAASDPSSSIGVLRAYLLAVGPRGASRIDGDGRSPLHLLSRNRDLISLVVEGGGGIGGIYSGGWFPAPRKGAGLFSPGSPSSPYRSSSASPNSADLESFVLDLLETNPAACGATDADDRVPFSYELAEWVVAAAKGRSGYHRETMTAAATGGTPGGRRVGTPDTDFIRGSPDTDFIRGSPDTEFVGLEKVERDRSTRRFEIDQRQGEGTAVAEAELSGMRDDRSIVSGFTNLSLPSAFRSIYSSKMDNGGRGPIGAGADKGGLPTRNTFRKNQVQGNGEQGGRSFADVWANPDINGNENKETSALRKGGNMEAEKTPASVRVQVTSLTGDVTDEELFENNEEESLDIDDVFPLDVSIPPLVEWNLRMLSKILDAIDGMHFSGSGSSSGGGEEGGDPVLRHRENIRSSLISNIASIPSFIKTLLLTSDSDTAKARVLDLSIVRAVLTSRHAVDSWIVYMMEAVDARVARRAVAYIEMISGLPDNVLPPAERAAMYRRLGRLSYLLPSLVALEEQCDVERAASTEAIQEVLDEELGAGLSMLFAFLDLFHRLLLLVSFHMAMDHRLSGGDYGTRHVVTFYASLLAILYLASRKLGKMSATVKISRNSFWSNNFRFSDFIDWAAVGMVLGGVAWMEMLALEGKKGGTAEGASHALRIYLACATAMVWLKLLVWVCTVNREAAGFVQILCQVSSNESQ